MRKPTIAAVLAVAFIALAGCAADTPRPAATATSTPTPTSREPERTEVDWENYPPEAQRLIDEDSENGNCQMLQDTFDTAEGYNTRQRERTGDGNADLMTYIDEAMRLGGCYE